MKTRLTAASFGLAVAAALFLLVWPVYSGSVGGQPARATLIQINGPSVLIPVMFPVFLTLMPLLLRKQFVRIIVTVLIGAFVVLAGFSIGLLYLPAAIFMLIASSVPDSAKTDWRPPILR
jgi:hypothetical protein